MSEITDPEASLKGTEGAFGGGAFLLDFHFSAEAHLGVHWQYIDDERELAEDMRVTMSEFWIDDDQEITSTLHPW